MVSTTTNNLCVTPQLDKMKEDKNLIEADITLAVLCFLCVLLGIPANILSLNYFLKKTSNISTRIYIAINSTDLITCIMVFPVGRLASFYCSTRILMLYIFKFSTF